MQYRLTVLTHGRDVTLSRALESFREHVRPHPAEKVLVCDGPMRCESDVMRYFDEVSAGKCQEGFCAATQRAWWAGMMGAPEFVFHLEHDFEFTRDVDLGLIADQLAADPGLFQMSLMRDAVSDEEREAGGLAELLVQKNPRALDNWYAGTPRQFLIHNQYFTTNPSLMRRSVMEENLFTEDAPFCEGKFGIRLRDAGWYFGIWGDGSPWVRHIGKRSGKGY